MRNEHLSGVWRSYTDAERISLLKRLRVIDTAITAKELGIDFPEGIKHLDQLADQAGLVSVYVTVVDVAGMRDYEPGVAAPAFASRHRKRKSIQ